MKDMENKDERKKMEDEERDAGADGFLQSQTMTKILLGIIAALLICILILLTVLVFGREKPAEESVNLQQSITDYAKQQQELEEQALAEETDVEKADDAADRLPLQTQREPEEEVEVEPVSAEDDAKTAVVVDIEDESDEAYTKEFILKEAYPYFADNDQDAIWDLAHLKRYVKLSKGLEGTEDYYYQGDVDSEGRPDGTGLAIYEKNSYYFGGWSHGVRNGQGTWFRFYINQKNKTNEMGIYMSHSYSGAWKNNLPNGEGAEHFDVDISKLEPTRKVMIQNVVGNFTDGLYDGDLYANTVDYIGNVQEWDGIAEKGVFKLWRDMSAIGECSVWRYREDKNVCLDIDKSENKNQGLRELLK